MNLGILTGAGSLSARVVGAAEGLKRPYFHFTLSPWLPLGASVNIFLSRVRRSWGTTALDPFKFQRIDHVLKSKNISEVFLTGDLPRTRLAQLLQSHSGQISENIGDELFREYFKRTPNELTFFMRYMMALENLFEAAGVRVLLAHEIFHGFNLSAGTNSAAKPSDEFLARLPATISQLLSYRHAARATRVRPAEAVIVDQSVDGASVYSVEERGTDELLRTFCRIDTPRIFPVLFKLPCLEINPALDQPTIGSRTAENCAAAGVQGIVVCAETTVVVDIETTARAIDRSGIFLFAIPLKQLQSMHRESVPGA